MKLSTATVAVAVSAALASASPLPLRIIVVSSTNANANGIDLPKPEPFVNMRLGHAVPAPDVARLHTASAAATFVPAFPGPPAAPHDFPALMHVGGMAMKKPCGGMRGGRFRAKFHEKAVELANTFRKAFGMPLIDTQHDPKTHHHHGMHRPVEVQVVPMHKGQGGSTVVKMDGGMKGAAGWWGHTKGGERVQIVSAGPGVGHHHHHEHIERPIGALEPEKPFTDRLMLALMSLGPWEGRFVAFVIGAGIGVLIRMVYVLCVVMFRSGRKESEYEVVPEDDEDEEDSGRRRTPLSAPPEYVYPVDEKIVYAQEVQKAPAAAEGPN